MLSILYSPHMTSVDNELGLASGYADVPLADRGEEEAKDLGRHYASEQFVAVFCSDLQRARATAEIAFATRGLPILVDARLRECDYGEMTQCRRDIVDEQFPLRIADPFPGGESVLMVVRRVGAFLRAVAPAYQRQTIVVIGHRATRYGLAYWCGDNSLDEIVRAEWEWREVPIWRYELQQGALPRHAAHADE